METGCDVFDSFVDALQESGIAAMDDEELNPHGELFSDLHAIDDAALAALPSIDAFSTLRSTQQSADASQQRRLLLDAPTAVDSDIEDDTDRVYHFYEAVDVVGDSDDERDNMYDGLARLMTEH